MEFVLTRSPREEKKWRITNGTKHIDFGAEGYSDFTMMKNEKRKEAYISRHASREDWNKSGILTAGFWSRWILWNKLTLEESIRDTEKRFNIKIHKK
jgi:hypothetical protein